MEARPAGTSSWTLHYWKSTSRECSIYEPWNNEPWNNEPWNNEPWNSTLWNRFIRMANYVSMVNWYRINPMLYSVYLFKNDVMTEQANASFIKPHVHVWKVTVLSSHLATVEAAASWPGLRRWPPPSLASQAGGALGPAPNVAAVCQTRPSVSPARNICMIQ